MRVKINGRIPAVGLAGFLILIQASSALPQPAAAEGFDSRHLNGIYTSASGGNDLLVEGVLYNDVDAINAVINEQTIQAVRRDTRASFVYSMKDANCVVSLTPCQTTDGKHAFHAETVAGTCINPEDPVQKALADVMGDFVRGEDPPAEGGE